MIALLTLGLRAIEKTRDRWINISIILFALILRLIWLGLKPAHFDEGVNGWFVDSMTRQGYYHYDPTNFHGPFHFYVLFLAQTLLGREIWVLRLPLALVSTGCVAMVLAYRCYFQTRVCQIAALAMAISPAMVFYGRYAIHESWLLFFLLLTVWGGAGLWRFGKRKHLWAAAMGLTGMILTKETYLIHVVALVLAVPCLLFYEKASHSTRFPFAGWKFGKIEVLKAALVSAALIVFFYTGAFLDWPSWKAPASGPRGGLAGLYETFGAWIQTGVGKDASGNEHLTGHEKPWHYWLQLMAGVECEKDAPHPIFRKTIASELPALIGLLVSLALLWPRTNRLGRYLAVYGLGALIGYSLVPYKTPWCIIVLAWPFYFVFGLAVMRFAQKVDRWVAGGLTLVLFAFTLHATWQLNFHHFADEYEPYVYVQTREDINKLLDPLQALVKRDPRNRYITGHILVPEQHPFYWLLADYPKIEMSTVDPLPDPIDADILLVDDPLVDSVEEVLRFNYFKTPLKVRGKSAESATLYLRQSAFGVVFPGRTPEFEPGKPKAPEQEEEK
jgi:uncharacterized protein (TIGR03663 family)